MGQSLLHAFFMVSWIKLGDEVRSRMKHFTNVLRVSNVTGILMEMSCHFMSHKLTTVWYKSTPNTMTIRCHLFSMLEHDIDFEQVQVMEFPWHLLTK